MSKPLPRPDCSFMSTQSAVSSASFRSITSLKNRAPVAQKVKRWPADLAVPGSRLAGGEHLPNRKRGFIAFSITPHRLDMTEIL